MEESAPKTPTEDILTPQDSLESTNTMSVTPNTPMEGTSLEGNGPAALQPTPEMAASGQPVNAPEVPEVAPQKHVAGILQNKLFRKVGLTSAALIAVILLMVGATFAYQKTHAPQLSEADQLAKIKDQSVKFSASSAEGGPASLRVGVATMFVNGDISLQGILRVSNGTTGYGQFDGTGLTGNQTYKLPNASGTICLDSGNCTATSSAQLAALGLSVASLAGASGQTTATTNGGVQTLNGLTGAINLQGTANQITITDANGIITLALPQDIAFDSAPIFGGLTLNGTATQNGYDICDNSNNCGFARGDLAILQGGNAYNTEIIMGAYDNYGLSLITNNTNRLNITNNGLITLGGATTDRIRFLGEVSGSTPLVFQGATDNFFRTSLVVTDPTANRNIILPNADGTICLTSGNCSGAGGYGDILNGGNTFNAAITLGTNDNYGVNIKTFNTNRVTISNTGVIGLLGDTSISANATLGASSASRITLLGQLTGATPLVFQGATNDSFATSFVITDPTANRTIVFPNADGTVCLTSGNCAGLGGSGDVLQGGNNFGGIFSVGSNDAYGLELKTAGTPRLTISSTGNAAFSADLVVNGSVTLGDANTDRVTVNGQITGGTPLVFQGATENAFATYFTIADPTANRTIILPNADGTICLSSGNCSTSGGTGDVNNGGNNYNSTMVLGTNDNFGLTLKTNNTDRITISNTGLTTVIADFVVNGNTLLGASSTNSLTLQGSDLFAPNNLNIDTYTQYIDTLNNTVGFGVIPGATSRVSILSSAGGDALTVNNGNGSGNILNLQDNGVNVVTVANNGVTTFKNSVDTTSAFQIQNAVGNTLLNADTTNRTVAVNGGPSTYTFTPSGDLLINRTEYTTATNTIGAIVTGDFNGDTWPDIASTNNGAASVSVFMNNGNGTFANKVDYTTLSGPRGVKAGDFDADGDIDLVIANSHNFAVSISVLMNNGNGTFAAKVDYIAAPSNNTIDMVEIADLNGDNRLDIVTSGTANAAVFINNGNGTFAARVDYNFTNTVRSLALADFNGDGSVDIAGAIPGTNRISILSNNGNGTFGAATLYTFSGPMRGLVAGDVNGDGRPDLATVMDSGNMAVLMNNGAGAFLTQVNYTVGTQAGVNSAVGSIDMADYNSDGFVDIITSNLVSSTTSIFLNNGNGTFSTQYQYTAGSSPNAVDSADFNKDGKVDAAIINGVGNKMSVLFGNGGVTTRSNSLSVLPSTINQTGIYVKSNVSQAADLIRVTDSGGSNAMFSIGGTGAALFRNSTDSTSAFQLQTAAGSTALNFDSSNNKISLYNTGSTTMGNFNQLSNSLLGARANHGTVSYNGYIYTVGGMGSTSVMYAAVSGGNTGAWASTTSLPAALSNSSVFVANGYIYAVGGYSAGATSTAYYAQLNGNGTVGTWNTTTSLPSARYGAATVTNNGYVYITGGSDTSHTPTTTAYYASLNSNGTLGAWQTATALPQQVRFAKAVVSNGYIYIMGGGNNSNTTVNTIYYALINGNGSLGSWTTSGVTMPYAAQSHELFSYGGNIYLLGGCSGGLAAGDSCFTGAPAFATVASTTPGVGGSLSAWQTSTTSSILGGRAAFGLTVTGGYAYLTGGYYPGISTSTALVLSAALPGSNSGTTFSSTSATFNTTVNIQNADNSYLMVANPGNNTLTVGATTTFKNITNSTSAFSVQNAAGSSILNIDSTNKNIGINGASTYSFTPAGPLFANGVSYTTASGASGVASGNLNGDAYPDFVTANFSANSVSVLINNGNGTFATKVDYATPASSTPTYLTVSDLNGDGRDDIAVSNRTNNTASVFLNNGNGTFGARADYAVGTNPLEIASGDLNGDNYKDLVIANYNTQNISVLINNGNGTFTTKVDYATFTSAQSVEIADLNNDNRGDIIVGGGMTTPSNNRLAVFMNSGTGTFPARTDYSGVGATSTGLVAGDFNGDGFVDIASSYYYSNLAQVYLNNGNGTLAAGVNYTVGFISLSITSGDYNGDGAIDLVIGNGNGLSYSILMGNGNGTFGPQTEVSTGAYAVGLATADFNQDGKQDVVRTNNGTIAYVMMGQGSITTVKSALSVAAANAVDTALYVKGVTGQTADLLRVADGNSQTVLGIAANGSVLFKNGADSTTALQIQNLAGVNLLQADTTNSRVYIGNATADATGALLVLDTKNTTGDPTGVDGSMYYNSFLGKFRCYEASAWANCVGGAAAGAIVQDGNSLGVPITIGSNDAFALNLETSGVTVATLSSTGAALFKNASNSTTAFQIQNSSSSALLTADTSGNIIKIGGAASATPTLLQLADGNNVTDPTGVAGAMYYNSAINRFRCYENGGWKNCITSGGGGGGGDILNGGNSGLGNMIIGNIDAGMLDLITANQVRLRIGAAGNVAISSTGTAGTVEKLRVNTPGTVDNAANVILTSGSINEKALVLQATLGQSSSIFEVQNSSGTAVISILPGAGSIRATSFGSTTSNRALLTANGEGGGFLLGTSLDTNKGLTIRGFSPTQSANLQEWQTSAGAILLGVTADGSLFLGQPSATTGIARFYNSGGAGSIVLQASNPGASNYTLNLPAESGTLCSTGSICAGYAAAATNGYVQFAPAAAQTDATTNSSIFVNKTNASGNIIQLQKGGANVLVVGNTGTVLVQNTANSTTAFQVQNAAGTSNALVVDTTNTRVGIGTNAPAAALEVNGNILYSQGANRTLSVAANATSNGNGYNLTVQAGAANGTGTGGTLNLTGGAVGAGSNVSGGINISTTGAFGQSGSISVTTADAGVAAGSINLQAGKNISNTYSAINIATSGGRIYIGAATNSAKLSIANDTSNATDNVLLVLGASGQTGALQAWVSTTNGVVGAVTDAGQATFLSIFQGANQVCDTSKNCAYSLQDAYNDSTNAEIVLGSAATAGLTIRNNATPIAGNLFEVQDNAGTVTYFKADTNGIDIPTGTLKVGGTDRINNSGTLLNVTYNGNTIGTGYGGTGATSFTSNGILFGNGAGTLQATAAGNSGQCLIATTGSAPSWGSCAPASSGNVNQGGNNYGTGMTVGTTDNFSFTLIADNHAALVFDDEARATFQNKSDATTAFQVQNAAGTNLFSIDSANSRIYVGNATPDSIGTILVLDNKNTAGDPTGVDGAMYYNSNLAKFRCYEDGAWKDCIYNSKTAVKSSDQTFSAASYADVSDLSYSVLANKAYRLSCSLLVSVPSGTNGGNISMTGPASPSQYTATFMKSLDQSSGDNYATSSTYDDGSVTTTFKVNTVSTGANRFIVNFNALLLNGANTGTWQLRAKAFANDGSSITIYANSSCNMLPL